MARKVFISFLGTSNYVQTIYNISGTNSKPVRFVQEALLDNMGFNFSDEDKILIFYTELSEKLNWKDNGQDRVNEDIEKIGLESILKSKSYWKNVESVKIDEGFSETEIWNIFDKVYSKLQEGDEIYFDVTHAFRSIPLFSVVLFNYSRFMKHTVLKKVMYGAFEKLGPAYLVKQMSVEERIAPVIDLSSMIQLQDLTQIASNLLEYGKIGLIANVFEDNTHKKIGQIVRKISKESRDIEEYIITNREKQIKDGAFVNSISSNIQTVLKKEDVTMPQKELLLKLQEKVSCFKENGGIKNIIAAIDWAIQYDMIQQAYTMAEELIITLGTMKYKNCNPYDDDVKWRNFISGIFAVRATDIQEKKFDRELADDVSFTLEMLKKDDVLNVRKAYSVLAGNRNILSHAKKSNLSVDQFKKQLQKNFDICMEILYKTELS